MKLNSQTNEVTANVSNAINAFQIKASAKAFSILSSGLYKNKILAFVRELTRNAYDAHIAAGRTNIPFEIHLPNKMEPYFHVKDYGTGLSETNMLTLYSTYFDSTKTDTNEFVGALGLGSKSPFSYTSTFTVKSRYDGQEISYACFISESGTPSIVKMGTTTYEGHPGLEVVVPIEEKDFQTLRAEVKNDLHLWEGTLPIFTGDTSFVCPQPKKSIVGKNWYMIEHSDLYNFSRMDWWAVQGNVAYPVSYNILQQNASSDDERNAISVFQNKTRIVMQFEIGKLDITASREELSYDQPTCRNLIERIQEIVQEYVAKLNTELSAVLDIQLEYDYIYKVKSILNTYSKTYGKEFIKFASKNIDPASITRNGKLYSLDFLMESHHTFYCDGRSDCYIFPASIEVSLNRRIVSVPIGSFIYVPEDTIKKGIIQDTQTKTVAAYVNEHRTGSYHMVVSNCWDIHRKVLPAKMERNKTSTENSIVRYESNGNLTGTHHTIWELPVYPTNNKCSGDFILLVNDLVKNRGKHKVIIADYVRQNPNKNIYVLDWNKTFVSHTTAFSLVNQLQTQLSGLPIKFLSKEKILLDTLTSVKDNITRVERVKVDLNEVTCFGNNSLVAGNVSQLILSSILRSPGPGTHIPLESYYNLVSKKNLDFSKGDYYFLYEYRNKYYIDEKLEYHVNNIYLNCLRKLGYLKSGDVVVALRPPQLEKIKKTKKHGKLIPLSTLDKKLHVDVAKDPVKTRYVQLNELKYSFNLDMFTDLFGTKDILNDISAIYGDIFSGKHKYRLFNDLVPITSLIRDNQNVPMLSMITYLEHMKYTRDIEGTSKHTTRSALSILVKNEMPDFDKQVLAVKTSTQSIIDELKTKYPLLKNLSLSGLRYSSNTKASQLEIIDHLVKYVEAVK